MRSTPPAGSSPVARCCCPAAPLSRLATPRGQTSRAADVSDTGLVVGQAVTDGRDAQNLGPRVWRC